MVLNFDQGSDPQSNYINPVAFIDPSLIGHMDELNSEDFLEGDKEAVFDPMLWAS